MNQDDKSSAAETAFSIIRNISSLSGQDLPRPVLIRFAWFCVGAVFVLASVRTRPSGQKVKPDPDRQQPDSASPVHAHPAAHRRAA